MRVSYLLLLSFARTSRQHGLLMATYSGVQHESVGEILNFCGGKGVACIDARPNLDTAPPPAGGSGFLFLARARLLAALPACFRRCFYRRSVDSVRRALEARSSGRG